jgi:hypothetical protein
VEPFATKKPLLGSAHALGVGRDEAELSRPCELVELRALVFEGLTVCAHPQIDRRMLVHAACATA